MILQYKKIQKFTSALLIIAILTPSIFFAVPPKKANAFLGFGDIVFDPAHTAVTFKIVAQEIMRQFLMTLARKLLAQLTQNTINWVNSGFHGNPLYLENSGSFFKDIAKYEIRSLANIYGYDSLRFPFGKDWALNVLNTYKYKAEDNAAYTLSKAISDPVLLRGYQNDFNVGGWNGFLINTQYPQNNYIGFQMIANETLARKLAGTNQNAAQKVQTTLQQGLGFLSPQTCPSNPNYNNGKNEFQRPEFTPPNPTDMPVPTDADFIKNPNGPDKLSPEFEAKLRAYNVAYESEVAEAKGVWEGSNTCPGGLTSTTPGSVVGNQVAKALGSKQDNTTLAAAMGNSIAAVLDTLMSHFLNKGLNALSNKISPSGGNEDINSFEYMGDTINSTKNIELPTPTQIPGKDGWCKTQDTTDSFGNTVSGTEYYCGATSNLPSDATCEQKCTAAGAVGIDVQSCIAMSCNGQTSNTNTSTNDNDPANTYNPLTNPYFDPYAQQQ